MNTNSAVSFNHRWIGLASVYACMLYWAYRASGGLSLGVAVCLLIILLGSLLIGDLFVRYLLKSDDAFETTSARLVIGALLSSAILFVSDFTLPLNLLVMWALILLGAILLWFRGGRRDPSGLPQASWLSETLFLSVAPVIVTIWCAELLPPLEVRGDLVVVRGWQDIFYHISQIAVFASSKGLGTVYDIQMAGAAARPYHFASYLLPALLVKATGVSALQAYACFLVPFGVLLTALAAYSMASVIFGKWPAFAGGLSVLLLPDAFELNFGNKFLGDYYWLQQIAPAGNYGVACAALAFMLMFESRHRASLKLVAAGYFFGLLTLIFKAQFFVAISFLIFVFPVLFVLRLSRGRRLLLLLALTGIYVLTLYLSQGVSAVPLIRPDGSGLSWYSTVVVDNQAAGPIRGAAEAALAYGNGVWVLKAGIFALYLFLITFGLYGLAYVIALPWHMRKFEPAVSLFPILIIAMYLAMAVSLAADDRHTGKPEELLHRPWVWAYFVLVVWCAAGSYHLILGDTLPPGAARRSFLCVLACGFLIVPLQFNTAIALYPLWNQGYPRLPLCELNVADFLKSHSHPDEVIQDSQNDPLFVLSALSERRAYAVDSGGIRMPLGLDARLASLRDLKAIGDPGRFLAYMQQHKIAWYVSEPGTTVPGRQALQGYRAYQCQGFDVYHF